MLEADALQNALDVALNDRVVIEDTETVAGGDIHRALRVRANGRDWFIKWNSADALAQFSAEAEALEVLARSAGPRVPHPLATGSDERHAWLVLEFLPLYGQGDASALGASLAMMHRETAALHGWSADNFIGTTPQRNGSLENWSDFWWRRRIRPQLDLARARGIAGRLEKLRDGLKDACASLLEHAPPPALLHGDLWGGNHAYLENGQPVIFDPASSYGDRETDLAMMRLFGGFDPLVFSAYEAEWPLPSGHEARRDLYQLYHVLNHLNLFGSGWLGRAESLAERVLRTIRSA